MAAASSLKEYLKRYESTAADDPKKKKKKKKPKPNPGGVLVVDEDPVWQKPIQPEEDDADDEPEERPQVDEDIEVKRMRRLEAIRASKPYHAISADGSGWVAISKTPGSEAAAEPDLSPPRQRRSRLDTPSPTRGQDPEAQDLSPPRERKRRFDTPSPEPEAEDLSPPRARRGSSASPDPSPPRRTGRGVSTDGDLSPPRRTGRGLSTDASPPRRGIRETAELKDLSPPRRNRSQSGSSQDRLPPRRSPGANTDLSPPRRQAADLSPPRRGRRSVSNDLPLHPRRHSPEAADLSPPRRGRKNASGDLSPPRRPTRRHSPEPTDLSPPRRGRKSELSDLPPPPRHSQEAVDLSPPRRVRKSASDDLPPLPPRRHLPESVDLSPPRKRRKEPSMSKEEPKTGLLSAKEIKDEIDKKKKQELDRFASMDPTLSGRGAEPVFRDKKGKRISKEDMLKEQEDNKPKEIKLEWGKGLAQKREAEARAEELELERDKPFARTRDDPELDKMLKDRVRWGDPMAHLVKRKHSDMLEDFGDNEKMKESGFIIPQTIPGHSWIKRGLDFPPNRYGIRPGRHWDGVDRSNGYEKELFKRQNEKRATESEAYLWSVSDM